MRVAHFAAALIVLLYLYLSDSRHETQMALPKGQ